VIMLMAAGNFSGHQPRMTSCVTSLSCSCWFSVLVNGRETGGISKINGRETGRILLGLELRGLLTKKETNFGMTQFKNSSFRNFLFF
jgi:hypothetical protein